MPTPYHATLQVSWRLGQDGQNLIYAKGQADCNKIASGLSEISGPIDFKKNTKEALTELSNFAKESVHPNFALAQTVLRGIGFHYGALPPLLRRSIEDCFRDGHLRFLACTSTLLHGLNLPAKNLFINKPYTGKDQPIESVDFWNLAGRAGRLGKEFEGNVFLVDYEDWPSDPIEGKKEFTIRPTITSHIFDKTDDFCSYIRDPDRAPDFKGKDEYENTFTKIFDDFHHNRFSKTLAASGITEGSEKYQLLNEALLFARSQVTLSNEILSENPTVSVYRQQKLYNYFLERLEEKSPEYLMPLHPEKKGAKKALKGVFRRGHKYIFQWKPAAGDGAYDRRALRASVFAFPWMRGTPIPQIIDDHYNWAKKQNGSHTIAKSIADTLDYIEKDVRFTYVKLTSCYNNLLRHALLERGFNEEAEHIVPIPLFLEVGACSQTMMSFIGVGLSRITARRLTDAVVKQNLSMIEAKQWLRGQNLEMLGLSPILVNEIRKVI